MWVPSSDIGGVQELTVMTRAFCCRAIMNLAIVRSILICLFNPLYTSQQDINIGAIFEEGYEYLEWPYRLAVERINFDPRILPNNKINALTFNVIKEDAFNCIMKVCNWANEVGLAAIFGPQTERSTIAVRAVTEAMKIPLILQRWEYRNRLEEYTNKEDYSTIYIHPHADIKGNALRDFIRHRRWKKFAVLYEDPKALIRLGSILFSKFNMTFQERQTERGNYIIRQVDKLSHYRKVFKDMKIFNIKNFVIDTSTRQVVSILNQAEKMNMITIYHNYLFTSLDVHTVNLTKFQHYSCNITMFRVVETDSLQYEEISMKLKNLQKEDQMKPFLNKSQFALMYDSVLHFATSLTSLGSRFYVNPKKTDCFAGIPWRQGATIVQAMKEMRTNGLTGAICIDKQGFRTNFNLKELRLTKDGLKLEGNWNKTGFRSLTNETEEILEAESVLSGRVLRVTVLDNNPPYLMRRTPSEDNPDEFEGHAVSLMKALSELGNFTFVIRPTDDGKHGSRTKTGEWNGMIGDLIRNEADVAVGDLTVTPERAEAVDFTHPFMELGISILYKKAGKKERNPFSFLLPFSTEVWFYMLTGTLGVTIVMYIMGRFTPYEWCNTKPRDPEPDQLENQFTLPETSWLVVGCVLRQGGDIVPRATSTRMAIGYWWLLTLIMISSYTANLAAFLTSSRMVVPIKSAEDLVRQQTIQYGCLEFASTYNFFKGSDHPTFSRIWSNMEAANPKVFVSDNRKGIDRVLKGNYAFFMESTSIEYQVSRECELTKVGGELDSKSYAIATPQGSPITALLSIYLLKLRETARTQLIKDEWWKVSTCPKEEPPSSTLGLDSIGGVFLILTIGLPMACFMVIIEFYWKTVKIPNDQRQHPICIELYKELKATVTGKNTVKNASSEDDEGIRPTSRPGHSSSSDISKISSKKSSSSQ